MTPGQKFRAALAAPDEDHVLSHGKNSFPTCRVMGSAIIERYQFRKDQGVLEILNLVVELPEQMMGGFRFPGGGGLFDFQEVLLGRVGRGQVPRIQSWPASSLRRSCT